MTIDATRILGRTGIRVIDTADVYGQGESEGIVGTALRGRRDAIVRATKFNGQSLQPDALRRRT